MNKVLIICDPGPVISYVHKLYLLPVRTKTAIQRVNTPFITLMTDYKYCFCGNLKLSKSNFSLAIPGGFTLHIRSTQKYVVLYCNLPNTKAILHNTETYEYHKVLYITSLCLYDRCRLITNWATNKVTAHR